MWNFLPSFLQDPVWQFVGALIAFVSILIGLYLRRKSLSYEIVSNECLLSVDEIIESKVKILYEDKPIKNVSLLVFKIKNTGRRAIAKRDFERPLRFYFRGKEVEILSAVVLRTFPNTLSPRMECSSDCLTLRPLLLNRGDAITIKLLISSDGDIDLDVDARIQGVAQVGERRWVIHPVVKLAITIVGMFLWVSPFLFAGWVTTRLEGGVQHIYVTVVDSPETHRWIVVFGLGALLMWLPGAELIKNIWKFFERE